MDIGALVPIAGIGMVTVLAGIPILGLTLRFAIKPVVESMHLLQNSNRADRGSAPGDARIEFLEQQIAELQSSMQRLVEADEFHRQLSSGRDDGSTGAA